MKKNWIFALILTVAICGCGKKATQNSGVATIDELNQALSLMSMGGSHPPVIVSDLTNFPSLKGKTLPTAPAGKKLVIDHSKHLVVLVNE
jgi:hypothetical protein